MKKLLLIFLCTFACSNYPMDIKPAIERHYITYISREDIDILACDAVRKEMAETTSSQMVQKLKSVFEQTDVELQKHYVHCLFFLKDLTIDESRADQFQEDMPTQAQVQQSFEELQKICIKLPLDTEFFACKK